MTGKPVTETGSEVLKKERRRLLHRVERFLEAPMVILGFVWLILLVIELTGNLHPALEFSSLFIWFLFILDFLLKLFLSPEKTIYLKRNWLTAVSLIIPAVRILRFMRLFRYFRALRGVRLIRIVSSLNRGMRSLSATMVRRGFPYIVLLTIAVIFGGAAGMYAFERAEGVLSSYATALWWTAMIVISMGTEYWPQSSEGRVLCFLLALYGFSILGYITATLASFFVGRDADEKTGGSEIASLRKEITELSALLRNQGANGAGKITD